MDFYPIIRRITAFLTSFLLLLGVRVDLGEPAEPHDVQPDSAVVTLSFADDTPGSAAGTLTLTAEQDGKYTLFWGDADGEKLTAHAGERDVPYTEFASVAVRGGKGETALHDFLAIPQGAQSVLVYGGDTAAGACDLPQNKLAPTASTYSFGALSDVHFNRYNKSKTGDDACITFPAALDFFRDFEVSMVAMSGDLSKKGEKDAYEKFNRITSQYDFPVFTCKGNHDCYAEYTLENWQTYINPGVYGENKREGVLEVAENGLDFVFRGEETHGDVFIFFSQISGQYVLPTSRIVTDAQLDWLEKQLETYKNERVYLFFHTFLNASSGNPLMGEGNLLTRSLSFYPLFYAIGSKDERRFRSLMETYKNVTFFNGHSHWAYYLQSLNPDLNITDYDGTTATMVHISSVSSPRISNNATLVWTSDTMKRSEGYLVTVYPDHYVLTACDFLQNQMLAYATYVVQK
ncbi:MAG: metallophosphoesterase [Clostridia bacterium]|nr:metallophosphoesterase [Clostridia bacterium]